MTTSSALEARLADKLAHLESTSLPWTYGDTEELFDVARDAIQALRTAEEELARVRRALAEAERMIKHLRVVKP